MTLRKQELFIGRGSSGVQFLKKVKKINLSTFYVDFNALLSVSLRAFDLKLDSCGKRPDSSVAEHLHGKQGVVGSIPIPGIVKWI